MHLIGGDGHKKVKKKEEEYSISEAVLDPGHPMRWWINQMGSRMEIP